ncbi:energy transducer TonB [Variovorax sp. OV700]|uniref:energy transducer TonB n=1 Tax=Variovorax sp. OV700 TaxID=1882826 RepID=UPI00087EEF8B|nr:energy transducer TonB [Variovorax sp. OV700]SDJ04492.1 TonB protein C-terminal [Variovorax sp. OV700]
MTAAPVPSAHKGRFPSSADGIRAAALCAVLSVALHGMLLSLRLPVSSPAQSRQSFMSHDEGVRRVVPLRSSASRAAPETHTQLAGTHRSSPLVVPQKNSLLEKLPAKLEAPGESRVEPEPLAIAPLPRPGNFGDDYVPRPLLTVPPVAKTPVIFAAPEGEMFRGRHVGVLSLFIDEHGQVQRIEADAASLPEAFEQAARDAFMAAQFSPGEIDGAAVKSRVWVEVIFDDMPILER